MHRLRPIQILASEPSVIKHIDLLEKKLQTTSSFTKPFPHRTC
uniref:Uncharacterized protein n=1 Tax=Meloidogyne enterolobii TaxID=390850 RepID=A0A6V7WIA7_MELEN|nr:unnamed protein product [Meloidogyne enterolobii]